MRYYFLLSALLLVQLSFGQMAKLNPSINRVGSNNYFPTLSGDGKYMLYRSDLSGEGEELWITKMTSSGQWGLQERFNRVIDLPGVNTMGGFYLNIDGSLLVFSSRRYGSMGGFDIWTSERKGSTWSPPQNGGKPLNTNGHEGDPSLSPDGKTLYFIRCEGLSFEEAINCSIWTARRKSNGFFEEPEKLPAPINTGHETSPLILADNQTLVFASARAGGKGELDLYLSRKEGEEWSQPVSMEFLNSEKNDRYVSIPARGDVAYYSGIDKRQKVLYMAKIPEGLRPYKVLYLESRVVSQSSNPIEATIQYSAINEPSKFVTAEEDGIFSLILREGKIYDIGVLEREGKYLFASERIDLSEIEFSKKERKEYILNDIRNGAEQPLNNIIFQEYSSELDEASEKELQRLIFILQKNPDYNMEIAVHQKNYMADTIKSNPDLTELIIDTIHTTKILETVDTIWRKIDFESLLHDPEIDYIMVDSVLLTNPREADRVLDSLNNAISNPERNFETITNYDTLQVTKIKYTWHNDRSQQQAISIANYLKSKGAPLYRLSTRGMRTKKEAEEDKPEVRVVARFLK